MSGPWHTVVVTELDPDDLRWAEAFGARWGATYSAPQAAAEVISQALGEAANEQLNARAIAHQKQVLGLPEETELTDAQARSAAPYMIALADTVLREMQWAMWWRRQKLQRGDPDPGVDYLTLRSEPTFLAYIEKMGPTAGRVTTTTSDGVRHTNIPAAATTASRSAGINGQERVARSVPGHQASETNSARKDPRQSFSERRRTRKAQKQAEAERELSALRARQQWDREQEVRAQQAARRLAEQARLEQDRILKEQEELRRRRPAAPAPQPYGVNHQGAERLVADWMRHLGIHDARVTQYSNDGGIDVDSRHVIAQVKNLHSSASVPIAQIRDLFGTATHRQKGAVLFTSGLVSVTGLTFADDVGMALIRYDAEKGTLSGLNQRGRQVIASGFPKVFGFDEF